MFLLCCSVTSIHLNSFRFNVQFRAVFPFSFIRFLFRHVLSFCRCGRGFSAVVSRCTHTGRIRLLFIAASSCSSFAFSNEIVQQHRATQSQHIAKCRFPVLDAPIIRSRRVSVHTTQFFPALFFHFILCEKINSTFLLFVVSVYV